MHLRTKIYVIGDFVLHTMKNEVLFLVTTPLEIQNVTKFSNLLSKYHLKLKKF